MEKNFYSQLLDYPPKKIKKLFDIVIVLFIVFIAISNKVKLGLEIFYLILTILLWAGGFIFFILFFKQLHDTSTKPGIKALMLGCTILILCACYVGPIVLYFISTKTR